MDLSKDLYTLKIRQPDRIFSPPCMIMVDRSYSVSYVDVGAIISLEAHEVPLTQNEDMSNREGIVQGVWSFVSIFLQLSKPKRLSPIARTIGSVSRTKKVVRVTSWETPSMRKPWTSDGVAYCSWSASNKLACMGICSMPNTFDVGAPTSTPWAVLITQQVLPSI